MNLLFKKKKNNLDVTETPYCNTNMKMPQMKPEFQYQLKKYSEWKKKYENMQKEDCKAIGNLEVA